MVEVKKTTYEIDGCTEPCFEVSDGFTMVRIAKMYHYLGNDTLIVTEFLDGEYNSSEEYDGDFNSLTEEKVKRIAREHSAYLEKI